MPGWNRLQESKMEDRYLFNEHCGLPVDFSLTFDAACQEIKEEAQAMANRSLTREQALDQLARDIIAKGRDYHSLQDVRAAVQNYYSYDYA